jgi:integrase
MGLGPLHAVSLSEARTRAAKARLQRLDNIDPIVHRQRERQNTRVAASKGMTFKACADAYITAHRAGWRNEKHAAQWPATLRDYVHPIIGSLPVAAVDTTLIMKILEQNVAGEDKSPAALWTAKPETASRVRGRIESILDWATARGYRPRGSGNPAAWRGHLEALLPARAKVAAVQHHKALAYAQLPLFMRELREADTVSALALEFTILCASRTGEVIGARWRELDLDRKLWVIPGLRMKGCRIHRVALSTRAIEILEKMAELQGGAEAAEPDACVFPGDKPGRGLSQMAMLMLLRRMACGDLTVHGFRSAFSDWCAEQTNFPSEVREMALAHTVGDKVEAAYRRGDLLQKRFALAEAWAQYCAQPGPERKVVRLAARVGAEA